MAGQAERAAQRRVAYSDELAVAWKQLKARRAPGAPTVISTFAGGGGSSMGYGMAGFKELLSTDWDPHSCACLRENKLGRRIIEGDITELSPDRIMELAGLAPRELDILDGSPPCQGFSTIGKRLIDDDRNALFRHFCRLLEGIAPRAFVMENVTGMVKGHMKLIFAEILRELRSRGYLVRAWVMNSKWFGVPQSRERVIFVGIRADLKIDPKPPDPTIEVPYSMAEALGRYVPDLKKEFALGRVYKGSRAYPMSKPAPTLKGQGIGTCFTTEFGIPVRRRRISKSKGGFEDVMVKGPSPTITAGGIGAGHSHQFMIRTAGDRAGSEIDLLKPSPTIAASSISDVWRGCAALVASDDWGSPDPAAEDYNPALFMPGPPLTDVACRRLQRAELENYTNLQTGERRKLELRPLSIGEVMRIQSFPDRYTWPEGTKWGEAWARLGNSVPPLMMRAIAKHLRELVADG